MVRSAAVDHYISYCTLFKLCDVVPWGNNLLNSIEISVQLNSLEPISSSFILCVQSYCYSFLPSGLFWMPFQCVNPLSLCLYMRSTSASVCPVLHVPLHLLLYGFWDNSVSCLSERALSGQLHVAVRKLCPILAEILLHFQLLFI